MQNTEHLRSPTAETHAAEAAAARERDRVRALAVGLLLLLPLHWGLGQWQLARGAEPWPMISLPGFGSTTAADRIVVDRPVFLASGAPCGERRIDVSRVLAQLPSSLHQGFMRTHFRPDATGGLSGAARDSSRWLMQRMRSVTGCTPAHLALRWERLVLDAEGTELERGTLATVALVGMPDASDSPTALVAR